LHGQVFKLDHSSLCYVNEHARVYARVCVVQDNYESSWSWTHSWGVGLIVGVCVCMCLSVLRRVHWVYCKRRRTYTQPTYGPKTQNRRLEPQMSLHDLQNDSPQDQESNLRRANGQHKSAQGRLPRHGKGGAEEEREDQDPNPRVEAVALFPGLSSHNVSRSRKSGRAHNR
jgi:hypothetical protein